MEKSNEYVYGYNAALQQVLAILAAVDPGEEYTEHWYNLCKAQSEIERIPMLVPEN